MAHFAWTDGDGTLRITLVAEGVPVADEIARLVSAGVMPAGTTVVQDAPLPADRQRRHAWRLIGNAVVEDPAVPDPPHPRAALRDAVAQANSLGELKAILREIIG